MTTVTQPAGMAFVLRSGGTLGWLIRLLTRSRVNHAGICLGTRMTVEAQAAGAVSKTEQPSGTKVIYGTVLYHRIEAVAPGRSKQVAEAASHLLGAKYNYLDLLALAYASLKKDPTEPPDKPNWWQRIVMDDHRLICSQLVDLAYNRAGVHLFTDGRLPGQVTPGDLQEALDNSEWPITIESKAP